MVGTLPLQGLQVLEFAGLAPGTMYVTKTPTTTLLTAIRAFCGVIPGRCRRQGPSY